MVLSAFPAQPALSILLDQIADELAPDPNLIRIKKLLLYVCTGTWENDCQRLDRAPLRMLLQHLFETCLTFEQLQQQLNQIVATLNKSAEYTIIAHSLLSRFRPVYSAVSTEPEQQSATASLDIYQLVGQQLEQETEQQRIKKLLLLTCRSTWESCSGKLEQLNMIELLQELHQIAPTLESLQTTLHQVAKALSKPDEYTALAERLSILLHSLYAASDHVASAPAVDALTQADQTTQTLLKVTDMTALDAQPEVPTNIVHAVTTKSTKLPLKLLKLAKSDRHTDLFDLRLTIMRDTNPFRAKVLLFSLLHEPFQAGHEALLKTHELDELLHILFLSYRLYAEVADKLRLTAQALSADYRQTAEALLKAIQPFYVELLPVAVPTVMPTLPRATVLSAPAAPIEITNIKTDTHAVTLPDCLSISQSTTC